MVLEDGHDITTAGDGNSDSSLAAGPTQRKLFGCTVAMWFFRNGERRRPRMIYAKGVEPALNMH